MPKVRLDWTALLVDMGESTVGWEVEMHLRTAPGVAAVQTFSTADGNMLVAQETTNGLDFGISVDASAADMDFDPGTYFLDIVRTDGGRKEDVFKGAIIEWKFIEPITEPGVA